MIDITIKPYRNTVKRQNMTNKNFSSFQITWIEFRATKSNISKKDETIFRGYQTPGTNGKKMFLPFPNKQKAISFMKENMNGFKSLSQKYEARLLTDHQFGNAKVIDGEIVVDFTTKQNAEMVVIG